MIILTVIIHKITVIIFCSENDTLVQKIFILTQIYSSHCFIYAKYCTSFKFRVESDLDTTVKLPEHTCKGQMCTGNRDKQRQKGTQTESIHLYAKLVLHRTGGRESEVQRNGCERARNTLTTLRVGFSIALPATHAQKGLSGRKDAISATLS